MIAPATPMVFFQGTFHLLLCQKISVSPLFGYRENLIAGNCKTINCASLRASLSELLSGFAYTS